MNWKIYGRNLSWSKRGTGVLVDPTGIHCRHLLTTRLEHHHYTLLIHEKYLYVKIVMERSDMHDFRLLLLGK
jgi:hypothetical protein